MERNSETERLLYNGNRGRYYSGDSPTHRSHPLLTSMNSDRKKVPRSLSERAFTMGRTLSREFLSSLSNVKEKILHPKTPSIELFANFSSMAVALKESDTIVEEDAESEIYDGRYFSAKKKMRQEIITSWTGLYLNLLVTFLYQANQYIVAPTSGEYASALGMSSTMSGVIIGLAPFAAIVSAVVLSAWSNYSYKLPLTTCLVMLISGNLLYAMALQFEEPFFIFYGRLLTGLGGPRVVIRRYIADQVSLKDRLTASSHFVLAGALGLACGPLLSAIFSSPFMHFTWRVENYTIILFNDVTAAGWFMSALYTTSMFVFVFFFPDPNESQNIRLDIQRTFSDNLSFRHPWSARQGSIRSVSQDAQGFSNDSNSHQIKSLSQLYNDFRRQGSISLQSARSRKLSIPLATQLQDDIYSPTSPRYSSFEPYTTYHPHDFTSFCMVVWYEMFRCFSCVYQYICCFSCCLVRVNHHHHHRHQNYNLDGNNNVFESENQPYQLVVGAEVDDYAEEGNSNEEMKRHSFPALDSHANIAEATMRVEVNPTEKDFKTSTSSRSTSLIMANEIFTDDEKGKSNAISNTLNRELSGSKLSKPTFDSSVGIYSGCSGNDAKDNEPSIPSPVFSIENVSVRKDDYTFFPRSFNGDSPSTGQSTTEFKRSDSSVRQQIFSNISLPTIDSETYNSDDNTNLPRALPPAKSITEQFELQHVDSSLDKKDLSTPSSLSLMTSNSTSGFRVDNVAEFNPYQSYIPMSTSYDNFTALNTNSLDGLPLSQSQTELLSVNSIEQNDASRNSSHSNTSRNQKIPYNKPQPELHLQVPDRLNITPSSSQHNIGNSYLNHELSGPHTRSSNGDLLHTKPSFESDSSSYINNPRAPHHPSTASLNSLNNLGDSTIESFNSNGSTNSNADGTNQKALISSISNHHNPHHIPLQSTQLTSHILPKVSQPSLHSILSRHSQSHSRDEGDRERYHSRAHSFISTSSRWDDDACFWHYISIEVAVVLIIYFFNKVGQEVVVASVPLLCGGLFGWTAIQNGLFMAIMGAVILPGTLITGRLCDGMQAKTVINRVNFISLACILLVTQFASIKFTVAQYIVGSLVLFSLLSTLEGYMMHLLSELVSPKLARGTFNSGLLSTEVGTIGRVVGDFAITVLSGILVNPSVNDPVSTYFTLGNSLYLAIAVGILISILLVLAYSALLEDRRK